MDYSLQAAAKIHQGHSSLPELARGRQCVPCSLMFLLCAHYRNQSVQTLMCSNDLHDILFSGSSLYCALHSAKSEAFDYVDPLILPDRIIFDNQNFNISHKGVISGSFGNSNFDNIHIFSLEVAFMRGFSVSSYILLVFCGVAIGIVNCGNSNSFNVFDSHSRDINGLSCAEGTSVLGIIRSFDSLCKFVRTLVCSLGKDAEIEQFDLHPYNFRTVNSGNYNYSFGVRICNGLQGFKVMNRKRKKMDHVSGNVPEMDHLLKKQSLSSFIDDRHVPEEEALVSSFHELVSRGPDYVCSSCAQTFFKHYVRNIANLKGISDKTYFTGYKSVNGFEWVCLNCLKSIKAKRTPKMWLHNGLQFPVVPSELNLSNLEERLVSPRLPFMHIRELPRGGQLNLRGNIVNVPADVNSTIKSLPRLINENETIMLKLKRRLSYKHHVAFENIRPNKVFEAAKWLVSHSSLFQNEGICVNETWLQQPFEELVAHDDSSDQNHINSEVEAEDSWTEDENFTERLNGNTDTCLQSIDFREFNQVLCVAPGEKNSPLSLFQDYQSEILSFPTIFCGQKRTDNAKRIVPLHYSDICKWELRNVDRRVATNIPNIFFKLKRLQIKQIKDKVSLAIRKCKTKGCTLTAGDLLKPEFVDKLTLQNDGYRVLRTMRGSPPYWESAKRDLFAMIRQLGIPTWFCSFSAAETKWGPLLCTLSTLVHGKNVSCEEAVGLSWQEKCKLIKSDPVTCARYFDHRVQVFIRHVLKDKSSPIGVIEDLWYRVEFQQRGSPHIHMVVWVNDAPVHGRSRDSEIASFVARYVTCKKDTTIPDLINYQTHRHASTCKKKGKNVCRFNFPLFPMPETLILYPLQDGGDSPQYALMVKNITDLLNEIHADGTDESFESFLGKLDLDYDSYLHAVRSTLSRPKVFLKRSVQESRINSYNRTLIRSWSANMDLQYILDPYSCVSYIVSYISKGQRGLSNLLKQACTEARETDSCVKEQVRRIGNQFLSSVEIGAQEAAYLVLQMPLKRSTRDVVYVETRETGDRTSLIKPYSLLKELPSTSKNIEMDNVLKRYKRRPKCMEQLCYADFASWYDLCPSGKPVKPALSDEELPETEYEHDKDDDIEPFGEISYGCVIKFPCGTRIKKRKKQKVIYSNVAAINHDREEHFRQKLMLYTHWRDDEQSLLNGFCSFEETYMAKHLEIDMNKQKYEKCDVQNIPDLDEEVGVLDGVINAECQHQEALDDNEGAIISSDFGCFDPGKSSGGEGYDIGDDIGSSKRSLGEEILPQKELMNDEYLHQVRSLNSEQKQFFYHILKLVKSQLLPFYIFLSGGAGVGKSVLTRSIYQSLLKFFNHLRHENPDSCKVLMCAPTGKAAHNIGGKTIHSAFCIPANQGFTFKPLDMQQLNTMRSRFHDLKIVIIDEISMVGRSMFNYINLRLQEIMGNTRPFGNVSILAVGDLFQLQPVMDAWLFSEKYSTPQLSCLGPNLWLELFEYYELKVIMRQRDDQDFAQLLNRLREGLQSDEDIAVLKTRLVEQRVDPSIVSIPHLYCTRKECSSHNTNVLEGISSDHKVTIDAVDTVSGIDSRSLQEKILEKIPKDPNMTMGLHKTITLGKGLPGELCVNIDTEDGLTNGAGCCIKMFDFRVHSSSRCSIVWVEFDDITVGRKWRGCYKHLYKQGILASWTPILETTRKFPFRHFQTYLVTRRQFPIYLSAARTIHKAQGASMKEVVLDFGKRKIDHIHYVGLSRSTSLAGIHILGLNEAKISVSVEVAAEMDRLRMNRTIQPASVSTLPSNATKVCFFNCRSLRKHFQDLTSDSNLMSTDIIGLAEARLWDVLDINFSIPSFNVLAATSVQSSHGLLVYYRNNLQIDHIVSKTVSYIEYTLLCVGDTVIGFVYCPPNKANSANVRCFLETVKDDVAQYQYRPVKYLVLLGDFNYDYCPSTQLARLFSDSFQLRQLIHGVTSDYGSCLDHIYTDMDNSLVEGFGTLESYYSDHKPVYLAFVPETRLK